MIYFIYFILSEFFIYSYHRLCHQKIFNYLFYGHLEHHKIYKKNNNYTENFIKPNSLFHYNFFLFLPMTIIVCSFAYFTDLNFAYFFLFYSFLTGVIHNKQHTDPNFYLAKFHEQHHHSIKNNFSIVTPFFDYLFKTIKR